VALQHTEIALSARNDDHIDVVRAIELLRGYEFKV
jgi:hypothetical protein